LDIAEVDEDNYGDLESTIELYQEELKDKSISLSEFI